MKYSNENENYYIRIALITIFFEGQGYYYSPYKFQTDNKDSTVPDENPIYIKVNDGLTASSIFQ